MSDIPKAEPSNVLELAADIVSAYVSNNSLPPAELPVLLHQMHATLSNLAQPQTMNVASVQKVTPAQIRKSIQPDGLISFEDGKSYKTLRRHLTTKGLTPAEYRAKWGLPADYPMTAASYSEQRSKLALSLGLGQQRRKTASSVVRTPKTEPEPAAETTTPRRSRKKAAAAE